MYIDLYCSQDASDPNSNSTYLRMAGGKRGKGGYYDSEVSTSLTYHNAFNGAPPAMMPASNNNKRARQRRGRPGREDK